MEPSHFVVGALLPDLLHGDGNLSMLSCQDFTANFATVGCLDPRANPTDFFNLKLGGKLPIGVLALGIPRADSRNQVAWLFETPADGPTSW